MARTLTPVDAHQIMNLLLRQATGECKDAYRSD